MKKIKPIVTRTAAELAAALGLSPADGVEIEVHCDLNDKIIEAVRARHLTHAQVAKISGTSRTRITAILNRNTYQVSTDLLLRILGSLGYRTKVRFSRAA
ncbi:MAG: XRE family transcriptional regulator [Pseudomonadota bacterium]